MEILSIVQTSASNKCQDQDIFWSNSFRVPEKECCNVIKILFYDRRQFLSLAAAQIFSANITIMKAEIPAKKPDLNANRQNWNYEKKLVYLIQATGI